MKEKISKLYDKSYKLILIIPALMLIFSLVYLGMFYNQHGDFIRKDVSLTGGTSITVFEGNLTVAEVETALGKDFPDISVRGISDIGTGEQRGFTIETTAKVDEIKPALEILLKYKLNSDNSSTEFSGAALSKGFYQQLLNSIIAAFVLMAWVVFVIFADSRKLKGIATILAFASAAMALKEVGTLQGIAIIMMIVGLVMGTFVKTNKKKDFVIIGGIFAVSLLALIFYPGYLFIFAFGSALLVLSIMFSIPSFAVILSAGADILMTVAVVNLLGISVSSAGIIAFLMLIGYSVDTDILLTSRLLKKNEGSVNERIYGAFKTGITMTLTSIASVGLSLFIIYDYSGTLRQIFTILLIGLFFDIFNTWFTNASMLKWYMGVKKLS